MAKFIKGLNTDSTNEDRPEGTWYHALNAMFNKEVGGVTKEFGANLTLDLGSGGDTYVLGKAMYEDIVILFVYNSTLSKEFIIKYDSILDVSTQVFRSPGDASSVCLGNAGGSTREAKGSFGWNRSTQIKGLCNKNTKEELVVYWIADDYPPGILNIDRQLSIIAAGTGAVDDIYGSDIFGTCDIRWIDKLRLAPHAGPIPRINTSTVKKGGSLEISTYSLALKYEMEDGSTTGNLLTSLPVAISLSADSSGGVIATGSPSFNKDSSAVLTGSAIEWTLSNINIETPKYIQPYIIKNSGNAEVGLKLPKIDIKNEVNLATKGIKILYEGMEGEALADINEIFNGNLVYTRAKAIQQFDDKLYLANLSIDPIFKYQKYANNIKVIAEMEEICNFDPPLPYGPDGYAAGLITFNIPQRGSNKQSNSYRNDFYHTHRRGYKRGETYAFYIAFIKADGSMSPAYHIPGRETTIPMLGTAIEDQGNNFYFNPGWLNFNSNEMNFWQNFDEIYPDKNDFDTLDITSGEEVFGISNKNRKVRHHHFPSSNSVNISPTTYQGASNFAVVQTAFNTGVPGAGDVPSYSYTNQLPGYDDIYYYVVRDAGSNYYNVANSHTTIRLAFVIDLNKVAPIHGHMPDWLSLLPGSWSNLTIGGVAWTPSTSSNLYFDTKIAYVGYKGDSTKMYVEVEISIPNFDTILTTHLSSAADIPSGQYTYGVGDDRGLFFFEVPDVTPASFSKILPAYNHNQSQSAFSCADTQDPDDFHHVNILGFSLDDVAVPKEISDESQGFRIYRAKRQEFHKTRIDQGLKASMGEEYIKISDKISKASTIFQIPIPGVGMPGWLGTAGGDGVGTWGDNGFNAHPTARPKAFYGFNSMRTRKSLNEVSDFSRIYALNNNSVYAFYGPHLHTADPANFDCENNTGAGVGYAGFLDNANSECSCWNPYIPGATLQTAATGPSQVGFEQTGWDWNGGALTPAVSDPFNARNGVVALHSSYYYFLNRYHEVVDFSSQGSLLSSRVEYIQGNTIETLKDYQVNDYVFNMGSPSFALLYEAVQESSDPAAESNFVASGNLGSVYHSPIIPDNITNSQATDFLVDGSGGTTGWGKDPNDVNSLFYAQDKIIPTTKRYKANYHVGDLYARRRNIYNDFDKQDLVWTGYEVLGEEYNRFIVDVDEGVQGVAEVHSADTGVVHKTDKIFGGDTFICRETVRITHDGYDKTNVNLLNTFFMGSGIEVNSRYGMGGNIVSYAATNLVGLFDIIVESTDNISLRHSTSKSTVSSPQTSINKLAFALDGICIGLGVSCFTHSDYTSEDNPYVHMWDTNPCLPTDLTNHQTGTNESGEEGIRYNEIYHYDNILGTPVPISNTIKEILTYPVRVTRSVTGGGVSDTYRNFPELDFIDVQTDTGSIWNLFIHAGILMVQTEDGLYKTKGKEQLDTSGGGDIYVGTGNIFAQAPERIASATLGVGGTTLRFSNFATKWGYFYIDYNRSSVNLFSETLEVISDNGMREWFQNNMEISLYRFGLPRELDLSNTLIGFSIGLDARYDRILVTKKSYNPTAAFITAASTNSSTTGSDIRWSTPKSCFEVYTTAWASIEFSNTTYFTPDDWTVSYYPSSKMWASFHSYSPLQYICYDSSIYSINKIGAGYGSKLYRHNNPNFSGYGVYYTSTVFPFEIAHSFNKENLKTKSFYGLNIDTKSVNSSGSVLHQIGLTDYYAHTDVQITGERKLLYMDTYRGVGGSWQVNDLRDRALMSTQMLYDPSSFVAGVTLPTPVSSITQSMFNVDGITPNTSFLAVGAVVANGYNITNPGSGYTPGPTQGYTPTNALSTGTGLVIDFTIDGAGRLLFISIINGGSGYEDGEVFILPGVAQSPASGGISAAFTIVIDKPWHQMRRIQDRYLNIFLKDDNSVKNSLTLLDSSPLYRAYSR